jgi:hypothetical protein
MINLVFEIKYTILVSLVKTFIYLPSFVKDQRLVPPPHPQYLPASPDSVL